MENIKRGGRVSNLMRTMSKLTHAEKAKKNKITLQNAEKVIGKEFGVSKWTIDGMYYDRNKKLTKLRPKTK